MKYTVLTTVLLFLVSVPVSAQDGTVPYDTVAYDEFWQLPDQQRLEVFGTISPENRAALLKTHATRWLATHRDSLSSKQVAVVEEAIAFIKTERYDDANREPERAELQVLEEKMRSVLSRSDIREAFTRWGPYIPPRKEK